MIEFQTYQHAADHFKNDFDVRMDDNRAILEKLTALNLCPPINWDRTSFIKETDPSKIWGDYDDGVSSLVKALTIITQLELDDRFMPLEEKIKCTELIWFSIAEHELEDLEARGGNANFRHFLNSPMEKLFEWGEAMRNYDLSHQTEPSKIFSWDAFDEFFSIENIMESQGQYQKLALDALQQTLSQEEKTRLINLLDLRLITLFELINSRGGSYTDKSGALIFGDTIAARLQINSSISLSLGLPRKRLDRLAGLLEQYEPY